MLDVDFEPGPKGRSANSTLPSCTGPSLAEQPRLCDAPAAAGGIQGVWASEPAASALSVRFCAYTAATISSVCRSLPIVSRVDVGNAFESTTVDLRSRLTIPQPTRRFNARGAGTTALARALLVPKCLN